VSQVSPYLRRGEGRYFHWCQACDEMHPLPDGWAFNGNLDKPTFMPSFKHTLNLGKAENVVCHYILTDGIIHFCADCWHALAGKSVPMAELPPSHRDGLE
jgi:hypothetical protein